MALARGTIIEGDTSCSRARPWPGTLARGTVRAKGGLTVGWFLLLTLLGVGMSYFGMRAGPSVSRRRKQQFLSYGLIVACIGAVGFLITLIF